jgi:anti-sigma B factor antagonist
MNFRTENIDNIVIFTILDNTLEGKAAVELKSQMLIVAQPDIKALIIDMSTITIIDSSGFGALLLAHRQLKNYNIPVILTGVRDFVYNLLDITRIKDIFRYYNTVAEAVSDIK